MLVGFGFNMMVWLKKVGKCFHDLSSLLPIEDNDDKISELGRCRYLTHKRKGKSGKDPIFNFLL